MTTLRLQYHQAADPWRNQDTWIFPRFFLPVSSLVIFFSLVSASDFFFFYLSLMQIDLPSNIIAPSLTLGGNHSEVWTAILVVRRKYLVIQVGLAHRCEDGCMLLVAWVFVNLNQDLAQNVSSIFDIVESPFLFRFKPLLSCK